MSIWDDDSDEWRELMLRDLPKAPVPFQDKWNLEPCSFCKGNGCVYEDSPWCPTPCPACHGAGKFMIPKDIA